MYLNRFADTTEPLDMTQTEEFRSLLASAADLSISHRPATPYRSRNTVLRQLRFHYLEWGDPDAPPIVLLHGGHQSAHSWDLVSLHLAQRYRVLALDKYSRHMSLPVPWSSLMWGRKCRIAAAR